MKIGTLLLLAVMMIMAAQTETQAEPNFSASLLNASDVDCKKCHTDTPHIIHAGKPAATCESCHGDKQSVAIPKCTKCHDGTIHKVHAGKVSTQTCDYCHKTVSQIHTNLTSKTVCSHCHKDLIEVHGKSESCVKCHKSPPDIVKPIKSPEMILICQDCHPSTSVATIHGDVDSKQGCYNCHKGKSALNGSEIPHSIHADKASCKDCHEDKGNVIIPKCTKCHDIDALHAFGKIGTKTDLKCQICHPETAKTSQDENSTQSSPTVQTTVERNITNTSTDSIPNIATTTNVQDLSAVPAVPGFGIISGIVALCIIVRKIRP